jgi:hypothetical protein
MMAVVDVERADAEHRVWMRGHLERAADRLGVTLTGEPRFGWRLRSIGAPAEHPAGVAWLRVGVEHLRWILAEDVGAHWSGIPDSNHIIGIPRPEVLASTEWDELGPVGQDEDRRIRADVMRRLPGHPCSPTEALRDIPDVPDAWWTELRSALDALRRTPTVRFANRVGKPSRKVMDVFGREVAEALAPQQWETTHGDLHWANVLCPQLGLLDWELWGIGPASYDAATLYMFSMLAPDIAQRVSATFTDVLDTPSGWSAQVEVASRILHRANQGENRDLAEVVRDHIGQLLRSISL